MSPLVQQQKGNKLQGWNCEGYCHPAWKCPFAPHQTLDGGFSSLNSKTRGELHGMVGYVVWHLNSALLSNVFTLFGCRWNHHSFFTNSMLSTFCSCSFIAFEASLCITRGAVATLVDQRAQFGEYPHNILDIRSLRLSCSSQDSSYLRMHSLIGIFVHHL